VFNVRHDEEFVARFLEHTQALLAHGVAAARPAGADARTGGAAGGAEAASVPHPNSTTPGGVHAVVARTRERQ
jgi:hypothetical protein